MRIPLGRVDRRREVKCVDIYANLAPLEGGSKLHEPRFLFAIRDIEVVNNDMLHTIRRVL